MKLLSFRKDDTASYGIVTGETVIDAGRRLAPHLPDLKSALANLPALVELEAESGDYRFDEITFLPPVPDPGRITCVGLNYRRHIEEMGATPPAQPSLFSRAPHCQVGHGEAMVRPIASDHYDFEGELAVVIGRPGRHIAAADALGHVAGYACFNDGSLRDLQREGSVFAGKNFWHSGAFGPWMVTADEIPDPAALNLTTRLNGEEMQATPVSDLLFDIPTLIAYISRIFPLAIGDVISTGTPSGVGFGRSPQVWMRPGDVIEVDIDRIGILRNEIVAE